MFFVFCKCPFLLRWKNVLSGSHALHLRFIRNKSVTRTVIITKTRPCSIQRFFHGCKNDNFQVFFVVAFFHIFAQNVDCGYPLEPPQ